MDWGNISLWGNFFATDPRLRLVTSKLDVNFELVRLFPTVETVLPSNLINLSLFSNSPST